MFTVLQHVLIISICSICIACTRHQMPHLVHAPPRALQIAEKEAQSGSSGSRAVRDAALQALLQLLTAVAGPELQAGADALAFFLPGIAVGLGKALLLAGAAIAGTSGWGGTATSCASSSAGAISALRALFALLTACLSDAAAEDALLDTGAGDEAVAEDNDALQQALRQLQALSHKSQGGGSSEDAAAGVGGDAGTAPGPSLPPGQQQQPEDRLRVDRSAQWMQSSAIQLHELLSTALPPLMTHPRPAVRKALVQGEVPAGLCVEQCSAWILGLQAAIWACGSHSHVYCPFLPGCQAAASFWTGAVWCSSHRRRKCCFSCCSQRRRTTGKRWLPPPVPGFSGKLPWRHLAVQAPLQQALGRLPAQPFPPLLKACCCT